MNEATFSQVDDAPTERRTSLKTGSPRGFDLVSEIGRGGMGVVWRARDTALDREVAVKILADKFEPDSATARRFVDEARITGQLQHPGVPAVYQVGALDDGRPFLAMKLIKGDTLDVRLKASDPLDALDPLAVFEAVAQAVGYAHAHGVIHRDLKPANVMVGSFGEVQVLDWGLAKVLANAGANSSRRPDADPEATAGTATEIKSIRDSDGSFTAYGSILGTPAYMAPEQAAGETDRTDARSDVFGLGAVLCVLLTGKPPFDGKDAESVRLNAVRGKTEASFARLDECGADPGVIALCKRCLAIEPADRPASGDTVAAEVAALRRAADDRARQAERDKLATEVRVAEGRKRRRALAWAGSGIAVVLLLGLVGTTAGLFEAKRHEAIARNEAIEKENARLAEETQRKKADNAKVEAQAKEAEATAVLRFFQVKILAACRPADQEGGLGKDVTIRKAVEASLPALAAEFTDRPLVEAQLRTTIGNTFYYLGDASEAAKQYERVVALFTTHRGADHRATLVSVGSLASSYALLGRTSDALNMREENLAACRRAFPPDHPAVLDAMANLAVSYEQVARFADGARLGEETLAVLRRMRPLDPKSLRLTLTHLAVCWTFLGRATEAMPLFEEALALTKSLSPDHPEVQYSRLGLSSGYAALGKHAEALALLRQVLAAQRRTMPHGNPDTLRTLWGLADMLTKLNRGAEAIPLIDEALTAAVGREGPDYPLMALIDLRLRHFRKSNDAAGCRSTAELWEKLNKTDAGSLYDAACIRAVAAGENAKAKTADAAKLSQEDADRAMSWLTKAVAAGFKERDHLETDNDLAPLRNRDDFKKLLKSLPTTPRTDPKQQ